MDCFNEMYAHCEDEAYWDYLMKEAERYAGQADTADFTRHDGREETFQNLYLDR